MPTGPFTASENAALEEASRAGEAALCPRCAVPMDRRAIPPREDVAYVRERLWLVCPGCRRTAVLDVRAALHPKRTL